MVNVPVTRFDEVETSSSSVAGVEEKISEAADEDVTAMVIVSETVLVTVVKAFEWIDEN